MKALLLLVACRADHRRSDARPGPNGGHGGEEEPGDVDSGCGCRSAGSLSAVALGLMCLSLLSRKRRR
jgi:hypothetical protein